MEKFKSKKVFLTEEELMKCREDMMQFASKEEEKENELEILSEDYKAKKKAFESEISTAKSKMRENLTLINQKFKYVDVPYLIFSDSDLKKELHIQTDIIELLEIMDIPPFANPELEFSNYCVVLVDSMAKADEIFETEPEIYSAPPVTIPLPETKYSYQIFQNSNGIRAIRFINSEIEEYWNKIEKVDYDIQDNEKHHGEDE